MANKKTALRIITGIKTIYPYYAKDIDEDAMKMLADTWTLLLKDVPDEVAMNAFVKALKTCKVPPTPADVLEQVNAIRAASEPTAEELWLVLYRAIRETQRQMHRFGDTFVDHTGVSQGTQARRKVEEIWQNLPDTIKCYLAGKGELMRLAQSVGQTIDGEQWEKQRFQKTIPTIVKRTEYRIGIEGGNNTNLLEG